MSNRFTSRKPTLEHEIHEMVHHGDHSVEELADLLGWSESSLYRAANPHDDAVAFPAKKLVGAMRAQNYYGPLFHMAGRLGFALYKVPRRVGRMEPDELAEVHKVNAEAMTAIHQFIAGEISQADAIQKIDAAIGGLARARRSVEHGIKQGELEI